MTAKTPLAQHNQLSQAGCAVLPRFVARMTKVVTTFFHAF